MSKHEDCIFCKIIAGEIPSKTIYENKLFKVIMDVNPASRGHLLILPKEHFDDIYDIDAETAGKLFQLTTVLANSLRDSLHCDGLNILQNNGEIAGQTVFHFHMHLIPRYEGDDVEIGWKPHEIADEDMENLRESIRKAL